MSYYYNQSQYQYPVSNTPVRVSRFSPQATIAMGGIGLVIGGTAAAAKNIKRVKDAEISREEAVKDTLNEAAGSGIATAAATAVVGSVGSTGFLSLLGVVAVATGTKYLWNSATASLKKSDEKAAE